MNLLSRIFCSNPFSFAIGIGAGLLGFYLVHKIDERRKLEGMQREIETALHAIETRKLALVEMEAEKLKK
ncbi:MAG: hypothetical protein ACT4NX_04375 [Deltaproteobacteria bacterium]